MSRLRLLIIALLMLLPLVSLQAQDVPPQMALALNQLSNRIGRPLTLVELDNWSYQQNLYGNTALGCAFVAGTERPEGISGLTFTLVYQGISYDYRVSLDGTIAFPCDPNVPQQPAATPAPANCPPDFAGFLPPRLNPGGLARIGVDGTANRMRELPNVNSRQIGLIQPGSTITILDGPSCEEASHIIWWRVDDNGTVGWTAEGVLPGDYFLAPLGSTLPSERNLITTENADTLVPLATISLAGVNSIAFPPDGTLIALGGRSGLSVYNMATLSFQITLSDISTPVAELTFSPDGRTLAYTTLDGRLLLRDTLSGAGTQLVNPTNDRHASLSFNPAQASLLASGSGIPVSAVLRPSMWRFYDLSTQQEVLSQATDDWVRSVAFSLDGSLFAWMDNAVHIIAVDDSTSGATLALEEIPFRGLAWRPAPIGIEPSHALAFPDGAMVRLVDFDASTEQTYLGDEGFIPQAIGFNGDGALLAAMDTPVSDTSGSTVNLFDVDTGDLIASTLLQASQALSFSPDSTLLVIASLDEVVFLGVSEEEVEAVG